MSSVTFAHHGASLLVTLSRPAALNSLTNEMLKLLSNVLAVSSSAVILRGAGGKAFCAGGDVRAVAAMRGNKSQIDFFRDEYYLDWALANHSAKTSPHVALWDGIVMGGGIGISSLATFRIATERTLWAMPETAIGLLPDVGGSFVLPRLKRVGLGSYLGLTGARLAGADAVHAGAASHFVPSASVDALVTELATLPPPEAPYAERLAAISRCVERHATPLAKLPAFSFDGATSTVIERSFGPSDGGIRGLCSRLESEIKAGGATGAAAESARSTLARMSPTSLFITAEQLRRGSARTSTLGSCLAMELRLVRAILAAPTSDFYEGIRAVLIDKGKGAPPAWSPSSIDQVDERSILKLFENDNVAPDDDEERLRKFNNHT